MTIKFGEIWKIQKCPFHPSCLTEVQQRPRKASWTGPITSHINIYNASSGVQCRLVQTVSKWIFDFTIEKRKKNQMLTGLRSRRTAAAARWKGQWWKCVTTCFFFHEKISRYELALVLSVFRCSRYLFAGSVLNVDETHLKRDRKREGKTRFSLLKADKITFRGLNVKTEKVRFNVATETTTVFMSSPILGCPSIRESQTRRKNERNLFCM